jgi:hypothetical protein
VRVRPGVFGRGETLLLGQDVIAVDAAFERPTKAISGNSVRGQPRNAGGGESAVWVQARARRAAASSLPAASDRAAEVGMGVLAVVVKRSL